MKASPPSTVVAVPAGARDAIVGAWRTTNRLTTYLVENLPAALWAETIPGKPRQTVGMLAAHLHNTRCQWIRDIGGRHGVAIPAQVPARTIRPRELARALARSSAGMLQLVDLGFARGGSIPRAAWQNFPTDLVHFLSYFVAHEAHHRGQLCLVARQLGYGLPRGITIGLWQWFERAREHEARPRRSAKPRRPSR